MNVRSTLLHITYILGIIIEPQSHQYADEYRESRETRALETRTNFPYIFNIYY